MIDLGVMIEPQFGFSYAEIREIARAAEQDGFRTISVSDHFFLDADSVRTRCLEAWAVLAALAVDTTTIRLGPLVSCQSYRNPALLAKTACTVDHLSAGRLDFGIGAGWKEIEYRAYGYPFPPAAQRVDELEDTVAICRALWTDERATYVGKRYSVTDAPCAPKPVQTPLPVWIGGRKTRMMRLAAERAEWFNYLPSGHFPTPRDTREGMAALDQACLAVGRDPATLGRSVFLLAVVGETEREAEQIVAEIARGTKQTAVLWRESRGAMVGTPEQIAQILQAHAAVGARHANIRFPYGHDLRMTRLLGPIARALAA